MKKGFAKSIKFFIVIAIFGIFIWFLMISPMITFHNNEKILEEAAYRYFDLNADELPTGERVKTLSLKTLYNGSYIKEDFYIPNTKKTCSIEESWVKVRKEGGHYKYYTYLSCGYFKSNVDHTGPQIKLNGDLDITINIGENFKDPGINSVVDDNDGVINKKEVTIKGKVDSSKVGTYDINYSIYDSLKNKTVVTRKVSVVKTIISAVKNDLGNATNYTGNPTNNYVRFSNMYFRLLGYDDNYNVVLVSEEDISNVNYSKIEKWLDEVYLEHFTKEAKEYLVETKFCNMTITEENLDTTQCTGYTKKRYAYIPSVIDINLANAGKSNFLRPNTISWVANSKNKKQAYATRNVFYGDQFGKTFISLSQDDNYGVRPKIVIKGDALIIGGDGSHDSPYVFGETKKAKGGTSLNTRYSGEYVTIDGVIWRIMETLDDGTTKVISEDTLGNLRDRPITNSNSESSKLVFNIKDKNNYAYYINNHSSEYINTSLFESHNVLAPVYKKKIIYGNEIKTNTFKMKISPPNMYDMFSAQANSRSGKSSHSYWLINTANEGERCAGVVMDIGVPLNEPVPKYEKFGVRAVGYIKSDTVISNGAGTYSSPYKLK